MAEVAVFQQLLLVVVCKGVAFVFHIELGFLLREVRHECHGAVGIGPERQTGFEVEFLAGHFRREGNELRLAVVEH
ncbi:hypothetical protein IMSAGC003_01037 [Lachnospiraceae bacterium]|nr:hypothetical protein IMSAGC003_01037 [Lachnospiraceae bacterium]